MFAVHLAAYKALCNASGPGLKTKTLHSEVVFMLSGGRHIVEAYRNFGPKDDTTALLGALGRWVVDRCGRCYAVA